MTSSRKDLGREVNRILLHIKESGCPVRIYKRAFIQDVAGEFNVNDRGRPYIIMSIKGESRHEIIRTLLHEFGHFLQWQDGTMKLADRTCNGWAIFDEWLNGKEFSEDTIRLAGQNISFLEYDADMRALAVAQNLDVRNFDEAAHYNSAHSYISSLKRDFELRKWHPHYPLLNMCEKKLSARSVIAPLKKAERDKINLLRGPGLRG